MAGALGPSDPSLSSSGLPPGAAAHSPVAERRLVSVLFADLVGFTTLAEGRDPEDTRELLGLYFECARDIVGRYGGTIEKFIGDAVMAVWGAPIAQEDDAERSVRAALELVDAVRSLGPGLQARAGVLTGEAAVSLRATNQGMVAGDLVNTASRLQAVAAPGTVLVGETTQRAAGLAIAFEPVGAQVLKGRTAPLPAFRALRVVGERGGRGRAETLEAPFVGRDDDLRLLKDLFHATTREGRARLVSVIGPSGIGKSRLAWEFSKYTDGLSERIWWHDGRSPAYGEGISFWALGEMVRGRCGLWETDDDATTRTKLGATLREHIPDEAERRWIEGALLALLGVGGATIGSAELFGAWRTFFERLSASGTVVLIFEDFNNADGGLIDFVDHLLEWSRSHPIFVLTLARPELLDRRPDWHAKRNFTAVDLEPLTDTAMHDLLEGLVPGLPDDAIRTIVARAEGIPLYAVETVRMLLADGRLDVRDGKYAPVGDLSGLAIPNSLTAIIASRLDGLDPADRALVHDAAVLGQSFTRAGLAAVSGMEEALLEPRLRALVRREILSLTVDPRSPERGQFAFVQALIREVAYNTLARADRRIRHLAAARFFESLGSDELAGALAGQYLAAYENTPPGEEAESLATRTRVALGAAAERAVALGSFAQAASFLEQALGATDDPAERASLLEQAGEALSKAAHTESAAARLRDAIELHREAGDRLGVLRATTLLGRAYSVGFRSREAIDLLAPVADESGDLADEPTGVALLAAYARALMTGERYAESAVAAERALAAAERLDLPVEAAEALSVKGSSLLPLGRTFEGSALLRSGIALFEENGRVAEALTARTALVASLAQRDIVVAWEAGREGLAEARRLGLRARAIAFAGNTTELGRWMGEWDWSLQELAQFLDGELDPADRAWLLASDVVLRIWRGERDGELLAEVTALLASDLVGQAGDQLRTDFEACRAFAEGRLDESRDRSHALARCSPLNAPAACLIAGRAAAWAHDLAGVREEAAALEATGVHGPSVTLRQTVLAAVVAGLEGRLPEARTLFAEARRGLLERGIQFEAALVALDMLSILGPTDPEAIAAAEDAQPVLERLRANPFLGRLEALRAGPAPAAPVAASGA